MITDFDSDCYHVFFLFSSSRSLHALPLCHLARHRGGEGGPRPVIPRIPTAQLRCSLLGPPLPLRALGPGCALFLSQGLLSWFTFCQFPSLERCLRNLIFVLTVRLAPPDRLSPMRLPRAQPRPRGEAGGHVLNSCILSAQFLQSSLSTFSPYFLRIDTHELMKISTLSHLNY